MSNPPGKPGNRGIRGIRHPLPPGTLIGRKILTGTAAPAYVTFQDLANYIAFSSGLSPSAVFPPSALVVPVFVHNTGIAILTSGVPSVVCSVFLTAGAWDMSASVTFNQNGAAGSTFSDAIAAVSTNPLVLPTPPHNGGYVEHAGPMSLTQPITLTTAVMRLVMTQDGLAYLLAQATFS